MSITERKAPTGHDHDRHEHVGGIQIAMSASDTPQHDPSSGGEATASSAGEATASSGGESAGSNGGKASASNGGDSTVVNGSESHSSPAPAPANGAPTDHRLENGASGAAEPTPENGAAGPSNPAYENDASAQDGSPASAPAGVLPPAPATRSLGAWLENATRSVRGGGTRVWVAVALVCAATGTLGSVLGARAVAGSDSANAHAGFVRTSTSIAATLKLAVRHEQQIAATAATYLAAQPEASPAEFAAWVRSARMRRRYPELLALRFLPPADTSRARRRSRDKGVSVYAAAQTRRGRALAVAIPLYEGTARRRNVTARRAAFVGWLREVLLPGVVLREALAGDAGYVASMSHRSVSGPVSYSSGAPQAGAQSASTRVGGGWTVSSFAAPAGGGVFSDGASLALLIVGVLASVLAAAIVFIIGARPSRLSFFSLLGRFSGRPAGAGAKEPTSLDLYDPVTGLPGRALTLDRVRFTVARAKRQPGTLAGVLFLDIDSFAGLNEQCGRDAGDRLLQTVARRLSGVVRAGDTVGRIGADHFVVLVETAARGVRLDHLASRMIQAMHQPVEQDGSGSDLNFTASIGVAFGRYESGEDLLRDARLALRSAKAAGKDRYTLFNANMRSTIESDSVLESELSAALLNGQLFLLYQPILDLRTRSVVGVEALVRWLHPKRGVLGPADFLPLAEETGLIVPIGRWVLEQACARAAVWEVAGHKVRVAVNVSANQLNRDGFITDVRRALQQSGIDPSLLTLEIAEPTVMRDIASTTARLHAIKQLGARIAIDGFGSAYAHRADLQRMQLDFLKVDLRSIGETDDEDYRNWLLEAIFIYARELSLTVIAEGIETEEQMNIIDAMGARMAQGFYLGRPISRDAIEELFAAQPAALPSARADAKPVA
jgi:diguanylate cyclase (GGDEF)-like protein